MMGARPSLVPPLITFSSGASPLLRLPTLFDVAAGAGLDGMDLDLSSRPLPRPGEVVALAAHYGMPVRAIWVPRPGFWTAWRPGPGTALATGLAPNLRRGDARRRSPQGVGRSALSGLRHRGHRVPAIFDVATDPDRGRGPCSLPDRGTGSPRANDGPPPSLRRMGFWDRIGPDRSGRSPLGGRSRGLPVRIAADLDAARQRRGGRPRLRPPPPRGAGAGRGARRWAPAEFAIVPRVPAWQTPGPLP
jgi:hypothetical protein